MSKKFFLFDFNGNYYIDDVNNLKEIYFSFPNIQKLPKYQKKKNIKLSIKKSITFKEYKKAINRVKEEIKKGNTYLLNLTFPTEIELNCSLLDVFNNSKAPFKLYFKNRFVSFSPERFITIKNNKIYTYPMKGTIDASIKDAKQKILNNQKELAEHTMVVDLLRNDLGIVARKIRVNKFRYIDKINTNNKTLLQVSSEIEGEIKNWQSNFIEIIKKLLPAGSISGTPKKKSVEIIKNIENYKRGFYTGIFGIVDFEKNFLDSAVIIRYIEKKENKFFYKSGGGITIDSNPLKEYEELINKIYIPT